MQNNVYIQFSVSALEIFLQDKRSIPSGNQNYIFARFTFASVWDGLNKIAILSKDGFDPVHVPIDDDVAQIPNEFMDDPGEIIVSVFAGNRRTVNNATIIISQSGFLEGTPLQPPEPNYEYVQTPGNSIPLIRESDDEEFQYFARNEWRTIKTDIDHEISIGIEEAPADDQLYGRKNEQWEVVPETPAHSVDLMFFGIENGRPVATHISPAEAQTILPSGSYFPASPGTWHNIIVFTLADDLKGLELEFIPGNSFTAKFWIRSDMLRNAAQFRLQATDVITGYSLATGTSSVDLGQTGELQPVIITGLYDMPAVVPSENIRMTLQVLTPLFGVQFGLFSIPPNEISFISRLVSGTIVSIPDEEEENVQKTTPTVYHANLSIVGSEIIIPLSIFDNEEVQIYLRYKYSTATEISISIKSAHTSNRVDMKRSTQWGTVYVEGSTIDDMLITSNYQSIDTIVYNQSVEMHKIWIRLKDYSDTDIWSIYEVNCFCSANGARTDIWVNPIYQGYSDDWK